MYLSRQERMAKKKQPVEPGKPRVGRPRANPNKTDQPATEAILAEARRLFRQNGFKGTSTREIAEAAGLRQPSLFHYFKNKNEIFRAVVAGTVEVCVAP